MASALSSDPNRRPQTAAQLADVLDRLADTLPGGESYQPRPISSSSATATVAGAMPSAPKPMGAIISGGSHSAGSLTPRSETPMSMLDNYIGAGRYQPKKAKETHTLWFYAWVTVSAALLLGLTVWLTVYVLTR